MAKRISSGLAPLVLLALLIPGSRAQAPGEYIVRGRIIESSGVPLSGGTVCAYPSGGPRKSVGCATANDKGQVLIRFKEPGSYDLIPQWRKEGYVPAVLPFFRDPSAPPTRVTLSEHNSSIEVSLVLPPKNGVLAGTAVDATTNLPIDNVLFTMCHADNPKVCFAASAKNAKGRFQIKTPHVPFLLKISAEGYQDWFGMCGLGKQEPVFVASAKTTELNVYLNRSAESLAKPMSDAEKSPTLHLPAPVQLSPADGAEFNHFPRTTMLEWSRVAGAVSYIIELDYCQSGGKDRKDCDWPQPFAASFNPPLSGITGTTYRFNFLGAQPGRWRVSALDENRREGFKSPWRTFVYLR